MKIFISWSGTLSNEVAKLLKTWLKCVLQATEPWISSDDIQRGSIWFSEISDALKDCSTGIVCLTKDNAKAPWILFEAGGLLKGLATSRVCTFLVNLEPKDIEPPLSQLNHTLANRDGVYQLISTLNSRLDKFKLDEITLSKVFDTYWPTFEKELSEILDKSYNGSNVDVNRTNENILTEILYSVRNLNSRMQKIEKTLKTSSYINKKWNINKSSYKPEEYHFNNRIINIEDEQSEFGSISIKCSKCQKRIAAIFFKNNEGEEIVDKGLCIQCAKDIPQLNEVLDKIRFTDEDIKFTDEQINAFLNVI